MNAEFIQALEELENSRGIEKSILLEALEAALTSAYKRNFGTSQNVEVEIDSDTGEIHVYSLKEVVEDVYDSLLEISLEEAQDIDPLYNYGDFLRIEVTPKNFGRIAAQTAKQVVVQRIREAERDLIFEEYNSRESDIITGIVQRVNKNNVLIDLGKTEGIILPSEQIPGEYFKQGDRVKLYLLEVKKTTKGPQVLLSRTHPGLVKRLFELEVPEIHDGVVEIFNISREAGSRTKIAVSTTDPEVDPVGSCVGHKGTRVKAIVDELKGEKIDIVTWSEDIKVFISNSLSPAQVVSVNVDEESKSALVVVPDYQLSLAIGKEGQNARLAAKLTGWKIDIKSESQYEASESEKSSDEKVESEDLLAEEIESLEETEVTEIEEEQIEEI